MITIIFEENGYEVRISETSHDILEKVAEYHPDVILMDNWIPKIGGVEATKLLKNSEEFNHIPVIYVTANNDIAALASGKQRQMIMFQNLLIWMILKKWWQSI